MQMAHRVAKEWHSIEARRLQPQTEESSSAAASIVCSRRRAGARAEQEAVSSRGDLSQELSITGQCLKRVEQHTLTGIVDCQSRSGYAHCWTIHHAQPSMLKLTAATAMMMRYRVLIPAKIP
eukprot:GHUV01021990.1.p1 GENE.GHUV01021990.1~~GHUV01021990.1.p1  ORF type:complete len:122 (+),score=14.92 GHUV01021990.1:261-626(+)